MQHSTHFARAILLVALAMFSVGQTALFSQVTRGDYYYYGGGAGNGAVGGLFGFGGSAVANQEVLGGGIYNLSSIGGGASAGYVAMGGGGGTFLSEHISVGGVAGFAVFSGEFVGQLNPEARYFFNPSSSDVNWFASLGGSALFLPGANQIGGSVGIGFLKRIGGEGDVALQVVSRYARARLRASDGFSDDFTTNAFELTAGLTAFVSGAGGEAEEGGSSTPILAQRRGSWLVGGQALNFVFSPQSGGQSTTITARAAGLRMMTPRWAIGGSVSYSLSYTGGNFNFQGTSGDFSSTNSTITVNPAARYYFTEGRRTGFFVQAGLIGEFSRFKQDFDFTVGSNENTITANYFGASLYPAFALALGSNVALEFGPELSVLSPTGDDSGIQILRGQVGLQYTIGGNQ